MGIGGAAVFFDRNLEVGEDKAKGPSRRENAETLPQGGPAFVKGEMLEDVRAIKFFDGGVSERKAAHDIAVKDVRRKPSGVLADEAADERESFESERQRGVEIEPAIRGGPTASVLN